MLESIAKWIISFLLEKLFKFITKEWEDYKEDSKKKESIKTKVEALKNAKTREDIRRAVRDLSI